MAVAVRSLIQIGLVATLLNVTSAYAADFCECEGSTAWQRGFIDGRLRLDSDLDAVDVEIVDGVVYLAGVVNEPMHAALAEQLAVSAGAVKEIVNRIAVVPDAIVPPETNKLVDRTLNNQVRSRFLTQNAIHGRDINVRTADRVVTLSGVVDSEVERELAYWLARNTKGVTKVINKLAIAQSIGSI